MHLTYCPDQYRLGVIGASLPRESSLVRDLYEEKPMKRLSILVLLGAMTAAGSASATGSFSSNQFDQRVIPVLVQVNANGKVTGVSPSAQLAPRYQRLLRDNIAQLITGPARTRDKAVSSQLVMNMALKTTPRADGKYDAHFAYISATPVPLVPMHWVSIDGRRLELARDSDRFRERNHDNQRFYRQNYPSRFQNHRPAPSPMPSNRGAPSTSSHAQGSSPGH